MTTGTLICRCGSCGSFYDFAPKFWSYVKKDGHPKGCWEWQGAPAKGGYGKITIRGKTTTAHRVAYQIAKGKIEATDNPWDNSVCHECDNRKCCNPDHLFLGTQAENMADRDAKGRGRDQNGMRHNMAKLTDDKVRDIRNLFASGVMGKELAVRFGVSKALVSFIVNRRNWKHI